MIQIPSIFFLSFFLFFFLTLLLFIYLFIYFLAVLGLRFCARAFPSCGKWGPLFIAVRGPLTIAASPVAEHRLQMRRLSNCGSRAQPLRGKWDLPRPGLKPVSPALAGRFSTTAPPGKPSFHLLACPFNTWPLRSMGKGKRVEERHLATLDIQALSIPFITTTRIH